MRLLFAAIGLSLLSACPGPGDGRCRLVPNGFPLSSTAFGTNGRFLQQGPVTIEVQAAAIGQCPNGDMELPEGVEVRVFDPAGAEVPLLATNFRNDRVELTVQAETPGWYHAEAEFLPSFGLAQLEFLVMRSFPTEAEQLPGFCSKLDRLSSGAWLCNAELIRDGGVTFSVEDGWNRWAGGEHVWTVANGLFRQYRDPGEGGLELVATGGPFLNVIVAVVSEEGDLYVRDFSNVVRVRGQPDGGVGQEVVAPSLSGSSMAVVGDYLLLDEFRDVGAVLTTYGPAEAGGLEALGTQRPFNQIVGSVPSGLFSQTGSMIRLMAPSASGTVSLGSVVVPDDLSVSFTNFGGPLLFANGSGGTFGFDSAVIIAGEEALEVVSLEGAGPLLGTSEDYVWLSPGNGTTHVLTW